MDGPFIYVGPSVRGSTLTQFKIFADQAAIDAAVSLHPGQQGMHFVSLEEYAKTHQIYQPERPMFVPAPAMLRPSHVRTAGR